MKRRRLTAKQCQEVEALYRSGLSLRAVEAQTGICREAFREHLRERGLLRGRLDYQGDPRERVLSKIDRNGPGGCWLWGGSVNNKGYGVATIDGGNYAAHRVVYRLLVAPIPAALDACHRCDNPRCVNPDHIFLGTRKDNMQDAARKGRLRRGDTSPNRVLTEAQVREAISRHSNGERVAHIAREMGIGYKLLHQAVRGRGWRWLKEAA